MPSGRQPRGDESIVVVASTKITQSEKDDLVARYGSMYLALRAGLDCLKESNDDR